MIIYVVAFRLLFFASSIHPVFACRNRIHHETFSAAEALKQSDLAALGSIVSVKRRSGPEVFDYIYEFKISRFLKGSFETDTIQFVVTHHSCAKFRQAFDVTNPTSPSFGKISIYLSGENAKKERSLLRIFDEQGKLDK